MFFYSLADCVEQGYLNGIESILACGYGLDGYVTYATNGTLIHKACVNGKLMRSVFPPWHPVVSAEGKVPMPQSTFCEIDSIVILELLLRNGCNINAVDRHGNTPLMVAVKNGRKKIIKFLVSRGADWTHVNKKGKRACDMANTKDMRHWLERCVTEYQKKEFYLQWRTDINTKTGILHVLPEHVVEQVCSSITASANP